MGQAGQGQAIDVENRCAGTDGSTDGDHVGFILRSPRAGRPPLRRRRAAFPVLPVVAVEGERLGPFLEGMRADDDVIMPRGAVGGAGVQSSHHEAQGEDHEENDPHRATRPVRPAVSDAHGHLTYTGGRSA